MEQIIADFGEYITESQANELQELGYSFFEFHYEDPLFNFYGQFPNFGNVEENKYYLIPTQAAVQKWLREEKNIELYCEPDYINKSEKFYIMQNFNNII